MNAPDHLLNDWGRQILEACAQAAEKTGSRTYLVGGPVRDLLREVPTRDLDLAVEGNESAFALELARRLSASLTANERFLTWKLDAGASRHVDLARLRTETYPAPGALPVVREASSIEQDLGRRDFTVNAMAIRLEGWHMIDPFGGRSDLASRQLRVLHDQSFLDDPTRIFRALRLGLRCGLFIEATTSTLIDEAVAGEAFETVTRERIWKELDLAFGESRPVPVLKALLKRGCLAPFFGPLESESLSRLPDNLEIPEDIDARITLLGVLTRGAEGSTFDKIPYDRQSVARIRSISTREPSLADSLASLSTWDEWFAACEDASDEERYLATVESPKVVEIVARFSEVAAAAESIRGNDLGVPPGPWIGRAIRDTKRALFSGEVDERDARAFASRLAMKYLND